MCSQPEIKKNFSAISCQEFKFSLSEEHKQICDPGLSGNDIQS